MSMTTTTTGAGADLNDFNTAAGPLIPIRPDKGLLMDLVRQLADTTAAAGIIDVDYLLALDGYLPDEVRVMKMIESLIAENKIQANNAMQLNSENLYAVTHAPERQAIRAEQESLNRQKAEIEKGLNNAEADRAKQTEYLKGDPRVEDGAVYSGEQPEAELVLPVAPERGAPRSLHAATAWLKRRPAVTKDFLKEWGVLVVGGLVEGAMLIGPIQDAAHDDNILRAAALSVSAMLSATAIPHFLGEALADLRHGARFTWRRCWPLLTGVFWLLGAVMIGVLRTFHMEARARLVASAAQGIAPAKVDLTGQFNPAAELVLWISLLTFVGVVIVLLKVFKHHPVKSQIIRLNTAIALAKWRLDPIVADLARLDAEEKAHDAFIAAHLEVMKMTPEQFANFGSEVLPAWRDEALAIYLARLSNNIGSPEISGLLSQLQADRRPHATVVPLKPTTMDDETRGRAQA
jgi:hypothetical protein